MKFILAFIIAAFAISSYAQPKRPCKEGQTEADGCHVVKKAEKKPAAKPAPKPAPVVVPVAPVVKPCK